MIHARPKTIPVFMLHSVNLHDRAWLYPYLSVPLPMVDALLATIRKEGLETLFLDKWYALGGMQRSGREIVLTFDDGYLDNWVYLYPLLEKYECRATIFVNPEFVQPELAVRRTLSDVWNKSMAPDQLTDLGYLNWGEISRMDASPWVDIQSHSMSHTWYASNDRVIDFHLPRHRTHCEQPVYPWLSWNEFPKDKPFSLNRDLGDRIDFGVPVFTHERSLGMRRFFPSDRLLDGMRAFANDQQPGFYYASDCRERLFEFWNRLVADCRETGRSESDEEMTQRYRFELLESKSILEEKLSKEVSFLCWPGGAYNDVSVELSEAAGYLASTLSSKESPRGDHFNGEYKRIGRQPMGARVMHCGEVIGMYRNRNCLGRQLRRSVLQALSLKMEKALHILLYHWFKDQTVNQPR